MDTPTVPRDHASRAHGTFLGTAQNASSGNGKLGLIREDGNAQERDYQHRRCRGEGDGGQVVVPASVEDVQAVQEVSGTPHGSVQAFPVFKAAENMGQVDRPDVIAWKVLQDLQDKVARYGLSSSEVLQVIRVLDTDLLAPFDIKHLGQVLFQPVQFRDFEDNWRQWLIGLQQITWASL